MVRVAWREAARFGVLSIAAACLAVGGCRRSAAPTTLRIAHESDVMSLDPAAVAEAATHSILSNVYEPLVGFDREMRLVPSLAVGWSTPDEWTWLLQLRKGVRFHDGTAFTARDAKYSLDRARESSGSGIKGRLSSLRDVQVVDPSLLRLRTVKPDPLLLNELAYVLIVPEPDRGVTTFRSVGTGPYELERWEKGRVLELKAFRDYWGGRPPIAHVELVPGGEASQAAKRLLRGEIHVWRFVPETMVERLRGERGVRVAKRPGLITIYLWCNAQARPDEPRNPFADRRVRLAVSSSIDRGEIVRRLGGLAAPAMQLVPPGVFGFISGLPPLRFAPEEAKRLLESAGYANGFDAVLAHSKTYAPVAGAIREMLEKAGIRLRLEAPEWSSIASGWKAGTLPLFLAGWRCENGDAASFFRDCVRSREGERGFGAYNPGFSDPVMDRLVDETGQIFGGAKRLGEFGKLMAHSMEQMPVIPLYHRFDLYGVSNEVSWEPRLDGKLLAAEMSWR